MNAVNLSRHFHAPIDHFLTATSEFKGTRRYFESGRGFFKGTEGGFGSPLLDFQTASAQFRSTPSEQNRPSLQF